MASEVVHRHSPSQSVNTVPGVKNILQTVENLQNICLEYSRHGLAKLQVKRGSQLLLVMMFSHYKAPYRNKAQSRNQSRVQSRGILYE